MNNHKEEDREIERLLWTVLAFGFALGFVLAWTIWGK